ncbi:MAG: uncharacterized protein JWN61_739 [Pseudonocardiales bacterium]|nr:uncharacterized protein [Jatrophihabitantaceae bacterium]MCW2602604.1 uncharacterized protein [Pseudonocardiales bacterium]
MHPATNAEAWLLFVVWIGVFVLQIWALADCVTRSSAAFTAAGKLSKPAWLGITAFSVLVSGWLRLTSSGLILVLIGIVASLVYLADVRPAVRQISGPSRW